MANVTNDSADGNNESFSPASAQVILEAACRETGLTSDGATLIRLGENALYRMAAEPVVVRIARTMDYWRQVRNEVLVAEWLESLEYPAARIAELRQSQPIAIAGHPVTFWQFISGREGMPGDIHVLAQLLHQFHTLPQPTQFDLPPVKYDDRVVRRLKTAPVEPADKNYLLAKFEELCAEVEKLDFQLPKSAVHGDAHIKNVMVTETSPVLIDFEAVGFGHPEWDLAMTATEHVTAQWWTEGQYATFAETYGFDITKWAGFDVVRQIQEIKMTTWLMQNVNQSREIAEEFSVRMQTIRSGSPSRPWQPY